VSNLHPDSKICLALKFYLAALRTRRRYTTIWKKYQPNTSNLLLETL